jgi:hypothetical protein
MRHNSDTDLARWGRRSRIPRGIKPITPWLFRQPQQIQSTSHHWNPTQGGREVDMVGNGEDLPKKTIEEIQREADEEIAHATYLAREAQRGTRHNDPQDDLGSSDDEPRDNAPVRRHHQKFNSQCPTDLDRLHNWSRSIREEIGRIEHQGEQVNRTLAQNTLALWMLFNQLTPTCQRTMKKLMHT